MVIKGKARGSASQLASYLLRLGTNERIEILEHLSPHATLSETFRDWEFLAEGTHGVKSVYHAQINPASDYRMTPEQWLRSVEVLEKELGYTGQPRAIVLHQKPDKNGIDREHIHVVWQRTDIDTMTLKTDSQNYAAHERASLALEREFGHEIVPGKHEKRDRQKQPEFPRADATHAEKQQAERTGIDLKQFREHVKALYKQSDTGQAFKAAVESEGLILAAGERGYAVIDEHGTIHNLARCTKEKTPIINQFMADVPLDTLPTVEEAQERQRQPKPEPIPPETPLQPDNPAILQPDTDETFAKLEAALKERHAKELQYLKDRQETERKNVNEAFDDGLKEKLAERRALQKAELDPLYSTGEEYSDKWMRRFIEIMKHRWNPAAAEQQRLERQQKIDEIKTRHRIERDTMRQNLKMERDAALDDLKAIHDKQQADHAAKYPEELARYKQEQEAAQKLINQVEEKKRQEELTKKPDEPDPPKPSL